MHPDINNGFRLSPQQRRLWLLQQDEQILPYRSLGAILIQGNLVPAVVKAALDQLVERHEILRTNFRNMFGTTIPVQVITEHGPAFTTDDADSSAAQNEANTIEALLAEGRQAAFDFAQGRLFQARLVPLAADRHLLLVNISALCGDAITLDNLVQELSRLYTAALEGGTLADDDEPMQYADIAEWQNSLLESEETAPGREYWTKYELPDLQMLKLPFEQQTADRPVFTPESLNIALDQSVVTQLEALAGSQQTSLEVVLLACWNVLLSRLTGQADLAVGVGYNGRKYAELQEALGLFARYLPLRSAVEGSLSFAAYVQQLHAHVQELAKWQEYFSWSLLPQFRETANTSFVPFSFDFNTQPNAVSASGLTFALIKQHVWTEQFKVNLSCLKAGATVEATLAYDTSSVTAAEAERLAAAFQTLVADVASQPAQTIGALNVLSPREREQVLVDFNRTEASYPQDRSLHQLFEAQVVRTPEAVAVVYEDQRLSYAELNSRSNQLARHLRQLGVGPEVRVAIHMDRSLEMVVSLLAVLKAGGVYVPFDPTYPKDRLMYILEHAQPQVLLVQEHLSEVLPLADGTQLVCVDRDWASIASAETTNLNSHVDPANSAYILYTSGSTGRPKGVQVTHGGICNHMDWMQAAFPLDDTDRVLQKTPFGFDASVWEFYAPLIAGAQLIMARPGGHQDTAYLTHAINTYQVTTLQLVPSLLRLLLEDQALATCASLRRVFCGGEALPIDLVQRLSARLSVSVHNLYGPTETTIQVAYWTYVHERHRHIIPIGRPISNVKLYILDAQLQPVPIGVPGELYIGGPSLARGYFNRPDLTAERFIPSPFAASSGERLYKTGDLVRFWPDGSIEFLSRLDHQVKLRGYRVELGEIEAVLRQHPQVNDGIVVLHEDAFSERRLVAYLVGDDEQMPTANELRSFLQEQLPDYMIPATFVVLSSFPLTPSGKIDRRALPAPEAARSLSGEAYRGPRTPVEEVLCSIWAETLRVEQVGIDDNFFALGGDSIRSVQAVSLAKERGLDFTVQQLFEHQTVEQLVQHLESSEILASQQTQPFSLISEMDRAKLPSDVEDAYPLTRLQLGMLYHTELLPGTPVYHSVSSWLFRAPFDEQAFHAAAQQIAQRHAILRTSFDLTNYSEPLQLVHKEVEFPVRAVDLRHLSFNEQEAVLDAFVTQERKQLFDVTKAPLMAYTLHRRTDETFQFTLTHNHAILDGWSLTGILRETFQHYITLAGKQTPIEESPIVASFRDFVNLEQQALQSEEHRQFWTAQVQDSEGLILPRWPSALQASDGPRLRILPVAIPTEMSDKLKQLARSSALPLKTVCLTAHIKALSLISGQRDIVTGLTANGRPEDVDGTRVCGLFLNTLPFRLALPEGSWKDLMQAVWAHEREFLKYRRYPLIAIQQNWADKPLFETLFNYVHFHHLDGLFKDSQIEILEDPFKGWEWTSFTLTSGFSMHPPAFNLNMRFYYDSTKLSEEQVQAIADAYITTLETMIADPSGDHSQLHVGALLSEEEAQLLQQEIVIDELESTFSF